MKIDQFKGKGFFMFKIVYSTIIIALAFFVINSAQSMKKENPIINTNKISASNMNDSFLSLSSSEDFDDVEIDNVCCRGLIEKELCTEEDNSETIEIIEKNDGCHFDDYIKEQFLMINEENFNMIEAVFISQLNIIEDYRNEASVKKPSEIEEIITQPVGSIWPSLNDIYSQATNFANDISGDIKDIVSFMARDMQQPR